MGTIAEKLNYLLDTKEEIKAAISEKGVFISSSPFREYAQKIREIPQEVYVLENTITSGKADVQFIDYDGTLIHSYTKNEFLALTEMPVLPSKTGLICQGWNWSLEDAKSYVTDYGVLDVGATYITDDYKTRLYIATTDKNTTVPLYLNQTVSNGVTIDWGDGSTTDTIVGTNNVSTTHTYEDVGDYIITLDVAEDCTLGLGWDQGYIVCILGSVSIGSTYSESVSGILQKAEIGDRTILHSGFSCCRNLKSVTIPVGITYCAGFDNCYSLSSIIIPSGTTKISYEAFQNCSRLMSVILPDSVSIIDSHAFERCNSLSSIKLPQEVSIDIEVFRDCSNLTSVILPHNAKFGSFQEIFNNCRLLSSIVLPTESTNFTQIGGGAFRECKSISSLIVPEGVRYIGTGAFYYCESLVSILMPSSLKQIDSSAFYGCFSLTSIVMPSGLENIGNRAFASCPNIKLYDFSALTAVPTLGTEVFLSMNNGCKIVVPDDLYDEWVAAENWSLYSYRIIKVSDFEAL